MTNFSELLHFNHSLVEFSVFRTLGQTNFRISVSISKVDIINLGKYFELRL